MRNNDLKICIIGGGNLAHATAAELGNFFNVSVLTRSPEQWNNSLKLMHGNCEISSKISIATNDKCILEQSDILILTLPATIRFEYLKSIKEFVKKNSIIITMPSIGCINFILEELFPKNPYACFQRVPYICRIINYGNSVKSEPKGEVEIFFSKNIKPDDKELVKSIFKIKTKELNSYYPLFLSNSNPIIHIARLCEILEQYPVKSPLLFYENWGNYASELALKMDEELSRIMKVCNVNEYRNLLKHYEVSNEIELTKKINSINSFRGICAPMIQKENNYIIDSNSRYVTEDLPFGTCFIKYVAEKLSIQTPNINFAIQKIQKIINESFVENNKLNVAEWVNYIGYNPEKFDIKIK